MTAEEILKKLDLRGKAGKVSLWILSPGRWERREKFTKQNTTYHISVYDDERPERKSVKTMDPFNHS